jgi:hypothetical protein
VQKRKREKNEESNYPSNRSMSATELNNEGVILV